MLPIKQSVTNEFEELSNMLFLDEYPTKNLIFTVDTQYRTPFFVHNTDALEKNIRTRRERLKSALYLRLKKRKTFFWKKT